MTTAREALKMAAQILRDAGRAATSSNWYGEILHAEAAILALRDSLPQEQPGGDARAELANIANARRLDRKAFRDDTEFADWAQSRCRHTLAATLPQPTSKESSEYICKCGIRVVPHRCQIGEDS